MRFSVSPAISALRWGAVGYGLVLVAPDVGGSYAVVVTVAVCLFITIGAPSSRSAWRRRWSQTASAFGDVVIISPAVGYGGGIESPFIFSLMIVMLVVVLGWGQVAGAVAVLTGFAVR